MQFCFFRHTGATRWDREGLSVHGSVSSAAGSRTLLLDDLSARSLEASCHVAGNDFRLGTATYLTNTLLISELPQHGATFLEVKKIRNQ